MARHMGILDAWTTGHGCARSHSTFDSFIRFLGFSPIVQSPVSTLIDLPTSPAIQTKSYLSSDPALVILYKQLREKSLQTLKGASQITPRLEWEFVIQNARLYDRMGCDLLALDLGLFSLSQMMVVVLF